MPRRQAIDIAMDALSRPELLAMLTAGPLPAGVKNLLRIVAEGECRDASTEHVYSRNSAEAVRAASAAFLLAVLFGKGSDPYRVLGLAKGAPASDVREHKRLMLKWLHPDRNPHISERNHLPKVIEACEAIESGKPLASGRPQPPGSDARFVKVPAKTVTPKKAPVAGRKFLPNYAELRRLLVLFLQTLFGAGRIAILGIGAVLGVLVAWRFVLGEPVGNSIERYARLTIGLISW